MGKKVIHVNRQNIAMNRKDLGDRPIYTIKDGRRTIYARGVKILGPSELVPQGDQLGCGARAWLETTAEIELLDPMSFTEARQCGK